MKAKKILIISHNPISLKQNNGKTLKSFLNDIPPQNIAQIYINGDYIDYDSCNIFFKINELGIIKKSFIKETNIGSVYENKGTDIKINYANNKKNNLINNKSIGIRNTARNLSKRPFVEIIRSFFWKRAKPIDDVLLRKFLDDFNPDVILYQTSNIAGYSDFVLNVKKYTNSELVLTITDDYLTRKYNFSIFDYYRTRELNKKYEECIKESKAVFVIGNKMMEEYRKKFPEGKYYIAMNTYDKTISSKEYKPKKNRFQILFAGNLGLSRWKTLVSLGKVLDSISTDFSIELKICSLSNIDCKIKRSFEKIRCINFIGALDGDELRKEKENSDMLLHVESFNKKDKIVTRLSISTKIYEYINSNRCILAIGPSDVASIEYIKDNNLGYVLCSKKYNEWSAGLKNIIGNTNLLYKYIDNCRKFSVQHHDSKKNIKKIQNIIIGDGELEKK